MTRFCGEEGHVVFTPHLRPYPGFWLFCPQVISSLLILAASHPPETLSFLSHAGLALFVIQQVRGKSKLKANI